jgi:hypothetical protein
MPSLGGYTHGFLTNRLLIDVVRDAIAVGGKVVVVNGAYQVVPRSRHLVVDVLMLDARQFHMVSGSQRRSILPKRMSCSPPAPNSVIGDWRVVLRTPRSCKSG